MSIFFENRERIWLISMVQVAWAGGNETEFMNQGKYFLDQWLSNPIIYLLLTLVLGVLILKNYFSSSTPTPSNISNEQDIVCLETKTKQTPYVFQSKEIQPDQVENNAQFDVIIVGAGIAGSSLAKTLGDDGRKVLLIERDLTEPDRIVGELLQPGGVQILKQLNLEKCLYDIDGQPTYGYTVFHPIDGPVKLPFPLQNGKQPYGVAFHHGRFVQNLRECARNQKNVTIAEGTVCTVLKEGDVVTGVNYKSKVNGDIKSASAPLTVVVDGCFSNFRKQLCDQPSPNSGSKFYGIIFKSQLPFPGYGHVFLAEPSLVLCYSIGTNETRMLIDIPNDVLPEGKSPQSYFHEKILPQLPTSIQDSVKQAIDEGNVRSMPCTTLHPSPLKFKGVIVLGDAWNMRHPLTGGGMTVALSDVSIFRSILKGVDIHNPDQLQSAIKKFQSRRKPLALTINMLAFSLYSVLRADMQDMRDGCFKYFKLGPKAFSTPMALLGGLETSTFLLLKHYIAVAFYSVLHLLLPFPHPVKIYQSFCMLAKAAIVISKSKGEILPRL